MTLLNTKQIIFIVISSIVVVMGLLLLYFFVLRKIYIKKKYRYVYYKLVRRIAVEKDYYLINNFYFKMDDYKSARIDHVLFGDKYVYFINSYYYDGDLKGAESDPYLILTPKRSQKKYTKNPLILLQHMIYRLSVQTNIDQELFIGIIVVNDDVALSIENKSKDSYFIQRNKLYQLIKAIESRNVSPINQKQLQGAVKSFSKMSKTIKEKQ